jgi:deoxyadenosine/deoxycytidine kinase
MDRSLDALAASFDAVVWLDARDDTLLSRIAAREKEHEIKDFERREALAFLSEFRAAYAVLLGRLAAVRRLPILRLDTERGTPEEVAGRAAAELRALGVLPG